MAIHYIQLEILKMLFFIIFAVFLISRLIKYTSRHLTSTIRELNVICMKVSWRKGHFAIEFCIDESRIALPHLALIASWIWPVLVSPITESLSRVCSNSTFQKRSWFPVLFYWTIVGSFRSSHLTWRMTLFSDHERAVKREVSWRSIWFGNTYKRIISWSVMLRKRIDVSGEKLKLWMISTSLMVY